MNQRDRSFLRDMKDFICMNRLATVLTMLQVGADPTFITKSTVRLLRNIDGLNLENSDSILEQLTQANAGNIQGIMAAKIYSELIAGYEDLGAFGYSIRNRASNGQGIFGKYAAVETRHTAQFLQDVVNYDIPNHPEITLDILLRLPPIVQLDGLLPEQVFDQLETYYREIPETLFEIAKNYRTKRDEAQSFKVGDIPPEQWQNQLTRNLVVILGVVPPNDVSRQGRLYVDTFNRIKHQFLVTGNLGAYVDPNDARPLEYVLLRYDSSFVEEVTKGVISVTRILSDFASILLLLDHFSVEV